MASRQSVDDTAAATDDLKETHKQLAGKTPPKPSVRSEESQTHDTVGGAGVSEASQPLQKEEDRKAGDSHRADVDLRENGHTAEDPALAQARGANDIEHHRSATSAAVILDTLAGAIGELMPQFRPGDVSSQQRWPSNAVELPTRRDTPHHALGKDSAHDVLARTPCINHFVRGKFHSSEGCPFSHDKRIFLDKLCQDFVKGKCVKGQACELLHYTPKDAAPPRKQGSEAMHQVRENRQPTPPVPAKEAEQKPDIMAYNPTYQGLSPTEARLLNLRRQIFDAGKTEVFYTLTRSHDDTQPKTSVLNIATLQNMALQQLQYDLSCYAGYMFRKSEFHMELHGFPPLRELIKHYCKHRIQ